jgi:hypothetical protein
MMQMPAEEVSRSFFFPSFLSSFLASFPFLSSVLPSFLPPDIGLRRSGSRSASGMGERGLPNGLGCHVIDLDNPDNEVQWYQGLGVA